MSINYTAEHVARITAAARGQTEEIDHVIRKSWMRCLDHIGLDPATPTPSVVLENTQLRERKQSIGRLVEIARHEIESLFTQIDKSGYAIILTDSSGVVLDEVSDPSLQNDFYRAGLLPGADWSETCEGTNGIGTCIANRKPVTVFRNEHFLSNHTGLICSGAPIMDPQGQLLAVLDASTVNVEGSKKSQMHTSALVNMSAKIIESSYLFAEYGSHWILRFHIRPEFVGLLTEGVLTLDASGNVIAANQNAMSLLGLRRYEDIIGQPVNGIFATQFDQLMHRARSDAQDAVWPLQELRDGRRYYARLRSPLPPKVRRTEKPRPDETIETTDSSVLDQLAGGDSRMKHNAWCLKRVLDKNVSILLQGETGTGKELLASAAHQASSRKDKPFVAVNCAAIPESLIESELFGYRPGAFTGGRRQGMVGKIQQSSGGTLFLDEIGDMPLELQTRLLRVLQEKEVTPLGGEGPEAIDLHVISATHQNLDELIEQGTFRKDLYYRLKGISLDLPALRERADQAALIDAILQDENEAPHPATIGEQAMSCLLAHNWPGNIRELRNALRTALALSDNGEIDMDHLPAEIISHAGCLPVSFSGERDVDRAFHNMERDMLIKALQRTHWNKSHAADELGISRNTLYRKMNKYGIQGSPVR